MKNASARIESIAAPSAGRTMPQVVSAWSVNVMRAFDAARKDVRATHSLAQLASAAADWVDGRGEAVVPEDRIAAFRVGVALLGRVCMDVPPRSFAECRSWFCPEGLLEVAGHTLGDESGAMDAVIPSLLAGGAPNTGVLLPHVCEVFVTGPTGASRRVNKADRNDRARKRRTGVFYTPSDVGTFLADGAVSGLAASGGRRSSEAFRAIDPACGTGALLRALCHSAFRDRPERTADERIQLVANSVFGVDLDPIALDAAAFALLAWCLENQPPPSASPAQCWSKIRKNLLCGDSVAFLTDFRSTADQNQQSALSLRDQGPRTSSFFARMRALLPFDIVIANPPFSESRIGEDNSQVRRLAYAPFVRMMWEISSPVSSCAIVTPLSIAASDTTEIVALRKSMSTVTGTWRFSFYDRAPDSLFGDDVKTRAAIAFFSRPLGTDTRIFTTRLKRWSSTDRPSLFQDVAYVALPNHELNSRIPKLGTDADVELYRALILRTGVRNEYFQRSRTIQAIGSIPDRPTHCALLIGGTAYNFLSVQPHTNRQSLASTTWKVVFPTRDDQWAGFALLSSRLAYWLWCVKGDGFHVNQRFVAELPFSAPEIRESLADAGATLWDKMRTNPIRSVNRSRTTVSYSAIAAAQDLDRIDATLLGLLNLPSTFVAHLRDHQRDRVLAGRSGHSRLQHHSLDRQLEDGHAQG